MEFAIGGVASIFVYIGAYFRKKQYKLEIKWWMIITGVLFLCVEILFDIRVSVARNYYVYTVIGILGAVLISYVVLCFSKIIEKNKCLNNFFRFFGNNSIIILCFHLVEMNNAPWWMLNTLMGNIPEIMKNIIIYLCKILFVSICTYIVTKIGFLRKIFGK